MCTEYANGAAAALGLDVHVVDVHRMAREARIEKELSKCRCADSVLRQQMAKEIIEIEDRCVPGQEAEHLAWLLTKGHDRGTDICISLEHCGKRLVPYPPLEAGGAHKCPGSPSLLRPHQAGAPRSHLAKLPTCSERGQPGAVLRSGEGPLTVHRTQPGTATVDGSTIGR